jgi:tetratricopeptide (TPR) repeat protein
MRKSDAGEGLAEDPERQSDLATSYNKLGHVFLHQEHWKEALAYYEPSLAIRRKLCEQTKRLDWRRDFGYSLYNTALSLWKLGQNQRALDLALERHNLAEELRSGDPNDPNLKLDFANALYFYADLLLNISDTTLRNWPKALELAQHAVANTDRRDPRLLALLAQALRLAKREPEALAAAEEAAKLMPPKEKRTNSEEQVANEITFEIQQAKAHLKKSR